MHNQEETSRMITDSIPHHSTTADVLSVVRNKTIAELKCNGVLSDKDMNLLTLEALEKSYKYKEDK